jgi:hypothetical protein
MRLVFYIHKKWTLSGHFNLSADALELSELQETNI